MTTQQPQGFAFQAPINLGAIALPSAGTYFAESGDYVCVVEKAEFRTARNNQSNVMLALTIRCIQGAHNGERMVDNLNLYNQSADAVKIAHEHLNAYATAMGADPMLSNTAQLYNKPFMIHVKAEQKPSQTDANKMITNNTVSDWRYADGSALVRGQYGAQGQQQQQGYASPNVSPVAPVAPVAPQAPAYAPQAPVQAPVAPVQAPQVPQAPAYAPEQQQQAPTYAQQAPAYAPQAPVQAQAPSFAPPATTAPFTPPAQ